MVLVIKRFCVFLSLTMSWVSPGYALDFEKEIAKQEIVTVQIREKLKVSNQVQELKENSQTQTKEFQIVLVPKASQTR